MVPKVCSCKAEVPFSFLEGSKNLRYLYHFRVMKFFIRFKLVSSPCGYF